MELPLFLPTYYVVSVIGVLGLIIGSFLDVFVSRFHTNASINGRSHCTSCGHTLSWYELIPFFSYVVLRGRCKNCGGHIPMRLLFMEVGTALLFVSCYFSTHDLMHLLLSLILFSLLISTAAYDMRHMVIPNEFVIAILAMACIFVGFEAYASHSYASVVQHIISGAAVSFFFAALWVISKGRWIGLGDAKLAFPLAFMLTINSAFSFVVLSFWIGAVLSVALLALQHVMRSGKHRLPILAMPLTMKSEVPFAPFMILAFAAVFLGNIDVLVLLLHLI